MASENILHNGIQVFSYPINNTFLWCISVKVWNIVMTFAFVAKNGGQAHRKILSNIKSWRLVGLFDLTWDDQPTYYLLKIHVIVYLLKFIMRCGW